MLTHMFIMNSSCNKVRPYAHTNFPQGYPLYSNLMIGGCTPEKRDGTNELSYLCIEAMHQVFTRNRTLKLGFNEFQSMDKRVKRYILHYKMKYGQDGRNFLNSIRISAECNIYVMDP